MLPIAIVAPVLRIVTDDTREVEHARLQATVDEDVAAISGELQRTTARLATLAGGPARHVLAGNDDSRPDLQRGFAALAGRDSPIQALAALRTDGTVAHAVPADGIDRLPGSIAAKAAARPTGTPTVHEEIADSSGRLRVLFPVHGRDGPLGLVVAELSLDRLVDAALGPTWSASREITIHDADGGTPRYQGEARSSGLGALETAEAPLDAPGFSGWTVSIREPLAIAAVSLPSLVALVLTAVVVVLLLIWMARKVLEPANELDVARHRMGDLYAAERAAALEDHLTHLGNHRAFQEELARQFDTSKRYHVPFSVLLIDLDEFKQVNDNLGHATGDELLIEVARLMRGTVRQADRAFRTGGDEFAIILPHTGADGAADLGRRLLSRMLEDRSAGSYRRPISFSGGVAAVPEHARDRTDLLARADAALYRSKRGGRTLVTMFDAAVDRPALGDHERAALSQRVQQLIADRALTAVYQPIVHLESGRPLAFEGLIRPAPDRGFDSTVALFTAADLTGRTIELDRACLDVVIAGAASLPEDVFVSLNISPRTFEAPEFNGATFAAILARHGIAPGRVILELTEREAIEDVERLRQGLDACRAMGVQIAADDVGAGNAGLRLLSQIKFDVVKIDLSLVQAGPDGEPVESVLRSLVDLAHRWGALVVAEGVETSQQLRIVRDLEIGAAQGFLLARPGPIDLRTRYDVAGLIEMAGEWWVPKPRPVPLGRAS